MNGLEALVLSLAVYYVSLVGSSYDGPFNLFSRLREHLSVMRCFVCFSLTVSGLLTLLVAGDVREWVLLTLAAAGLATIIHYLSE